MTNPAADQPEAVAAQHQRLRLEQLLTVSKRLADAIATDIAALEKGEFGELMTTDPEIERLCAFYGREVKALKAEGGVKRVPAPRLPAPAIPTTASTAAPVENLQFTNLYARFKDKQPQLTAEQVEPYLKANRRSAASLLAAYRTTGDAAMLAEAMQTYPNEPQVAFEAAFKKDASFEERHQWLEALKKSDPGNSLPNYLSALDYFKSGQADQAVQELIAASGKQQFQDYTLDR